MASQQEELMSNPMDDKLEGEFEWVQSNNEDQLAATSRIDEPADEPADDFTFINTEHCLIFQDLEEYRTAVSNYESGVIRTRQSHMARLFRYSLGHLGSVLHLARRLGWLGCCVAAGTVTVPVTRMMLFISTLPFYLAMWLLFAVHRLTIDN